MWGAHSGHCILLPFLMLKNAFKKHPLQNRTNVQIKGGGGQRPFEQCSKKLHFSYRMASLIGSSNCQSKKCIHFSMHTLLFKLVCDGKHLEKFVLNAKWILPNKKECLVKKVLGKLYFTRWSTKDIDSETTSLGIYCYRDGRTDL